MQVEGCLNCVAFLKTEDNCSKNIIEFFLSIHVKRITWIITALLKFMGIIININLIELYV